MNGWHAFRRGLGLASHHPRLLILLFAANMLSALLLVALPAWLLASGPGDQPVMREVADGMDAWVVIETTLAPLSGMALEETNAGQDPSLMSGMALLAGLILVVGLPLLGWLLPAFLEGGLLLTYIQAAGPDPQPLRGRRFLWACGHWWGAFLLLAVVQGLAALLFLGPLVAITLFASRTLGSWLAWIAVPVLALIIAVGLALMEYTRILAVRGGTRNLFRTFGQAVRFVFRHPLPVVGLYGLSLVLVALLHALFRLGLMPHLPLERWLLVLAVQQIFILARLATRLARLAGASLLVTALAPAESAPAV